MFSEEVVRKLCEKMFMEGRLFEKASYQPMSIPQTIDYYFRKFIAEYKHAPEPVCTCGHARFSHAPIDGELDLYGECDIIGCDECKQYYPA